MAIYTHNANDVPSGLLWVDVLDWGNAVFVDPHHIFLGANTDGTLTTLHSLDGSFTTDGSGHVTGGTITGISRANNLTTIIYEQVVGLNISVLDFLNLPDTGAAFNLIFANNDSLIGYSGIDVLLGRAGNDTLNGGAGADQMQGGQDNDTYVVDDAGDVVTELANQGTDTVQTTLGTYTLGANVENLTFTNNAIHTGFGDGLANVFTGSDGDDTFVGHVDIFEQVTDTFNGGNGSDTFIAEFSDIVNGGAGTDFLFQVNSNPWSIDLGATSIEWMSAGFGSDTINAATQTASVEVFAGGGNDTVTGSAFDDFLWLGAGNDTAVGGNGNDMLFGDIGADSLSGGDGNDNLYADAADTLISGGNGTDNLYWTENAVGANIDMAASSLEWAQTLGGNDTLTGATGAANLEVYAGGGTDIITGGSGTDFLWGEGGNDTITGNGGSDTLVGGTGADRLTGGAGLDTLYANSGNGADGALDTFVFTNNWGTDFVYDFENGTDKFDMTALGIQFSALTITTVGPHAQVGFGGNQFIVVNAASQIDASDFVFDFFDFTSLVSPASINQGAGGVTPPIFGRVFEPGLTEPAGAAAGIVAQLGYGPSGTDPRIDLGWNWIDATFNAQIGNDDEYQAVIPALGPGAYLYTYRFGLSVGGNPPTAWTYADLDGSANGFSTSQLGVLTEF